MEVRPGVGEKSYILYRDVLAKLNRILFILLGLRPIARGKIVVILSHGSNPGYSCNAKAIINELLLREQRVNGNRTYKIIWLVNDMTKEFPRGIKKVKNNAFNRAFHLSNAQIWIDSFRKKLGTRKRKGQLYIQTWHGMVGFKAVGKLRGASFPLIAERVSINDSQMIDYILSNSEWCSDVYRKAFFYEGEILKTGSPRCDILFHEDGRNKLRKQIRDLYHISYDSRIIICAPTFRGGEQATELVFSENEMNLDIGRLPELFHQYWGGEWIVLYRRHPFLSKAETAESQSGNIVDVTKADDLYEIMAAADVFISDYSSAAFDAAFAGIPVFLYADDYEEYNNGRGLVWDMEQLPFPLAMNLFELEENIKQFDPEQYREGLNEFIKEIDLLEDGHASDRVADVIDHFINYGKKEESCKWVVQ